MNEKDARRLLGQVFTRRLPPDPQSLDLERFPVGNYIVFRDALAGSFEESKVRLHEAKSRMREHGIEPFLMMDEEGGRVTQISGFFPSAPSPAAISRALGPDETRTLHARISKILADMGIDLNLAPCVDVNTEPLNPIIGTRAFGSTYETVASYSGAFIEASRAYTGCVAKHFPGHGMTTVDSHRDMPAVTTPREDLESIHIPPFVAAIRAGADGIMISHCCYYALQADKLPASLSRRVVHDLLRQEMGFDGLVITDSLDMDAVTCNTDPSEAPIAAFSAGADMLLYTENSTRFEEAFEAMTADLMSGKVDHGRLTESITRRHALLDRLLSLSTFRHVATHERYLELRSMVMAASVLKDDPRGLLPLGAREPAFVTTDSGFLEKAGLSGAAVQEIDTEAEAEGEALLLWLMEPLRLRHSLEAISRMIEASRLSVLVTSYRRLAETLGAADVKIVTDDTGPDTQKAIAREISGY